MSTTLDIRIPSGWEQLTDTQLQAAALLLYTPMPAREFDVKVLQCLMNKTGKPLKNYADLRRALSQHVLADLKKHYNWFYEQTNRRKFIETITLGGNTFTAPKPFLYDITIDEFAAVDDLHKNAKQAQTLLLQREYLEYMAAILYTPLTAEGLRPDFHKELIEQRAIPFKEAPLSFLLAMLVTYEGCRFGLEDRYKRVFPKTQHTAGKNKTPQKNYGFAKVILQLAGGVFGNHTETARTRVHTFLEHFNELLDKKPQ